MRQSAIPLNLSKVAATILAVIACFVAMTFVASGARANEFITFNQKYVNGKCSDAYLDEDCYHYVGEVNKHSQCYDRVGKAIGANPKTNAGKIDIYNTQYWCPAVQPDGKFHLYIFWSDQCAVGKTWAQCEKLV